ncbi:hypothetical protein BDZ94DRAFT_968894 [Collybia nuda]|uniref:Uncharacterized protein n=1 Tax=Collybia nuda TaxID=64659 RepID=A0A9P6CP33_9AGAR|nr:hypothetical protein BDZ94DRAFT_968894 [Collybia nuda]
MVMKHFPRSDPYPSPSFTKLRFEVDLERRLDPLFKNNSLPRYIKLISLCQIPPDALGTPKRHFRRRNNVRLIFTNFILAVCRPYATLMLPNRVARTLWETRFVRKVPRDLVGGAFPRGACDGIHSSNLIAGFHYGASTPAWESIMPKRGISTSNEKSLCSH